VESGPPGDFFANPRYDRTQQFLAHIL